MFLPFVVIPGEISQKPLSHFFSVFTPNPFGILIGVGVDEVVASRKLPLFLWRDWLSFFDNSYFPSKCSISSRFIDIEFRAPRSH